FIKEDLPFNSQRMLLKFGIVISVIDSGPEARLEVRNNLRGDAVAKVRILRPCQRDVDVGKVNGAFLATDAFRAASMGIQHESDKYHICSCNPPLWICRSQLKSYDMPFSVEIPFNRFLSAGRLAPFPKAIPFATTLSWSVSNVVMGIRIGA